MLLLVVGLAAPAEAQRCFDRTSCLREAEAADARASAALLRHRDGTRDALDRDQWLIEACTRFADGPSCLRVAETHHRDTELGDKLLTAIYVRACLSGEGRGCFFAGLAIAAGRSAPDPEDENESVITVEKDPAFALELFGRGCAAHDDDCCQMAEGLGRALRAKAPASPRPPRAAKKTK